VDTTQLGIVSKRSLSLGDGRNLEESMGDAQPFGTNRDSLRSRAFLHVFNWRCVRGSSLRVRRTRIDMTQRSVSREKIRIAVGDSGLADPSALSGPRIADQKLTVGGSPLHVAA
jgi:hypothetical protein